MVYPHMPNSLWTCVADLMAQRADASRAAWQPPRAASYEQVLRGAARHH